MKKIKIRKMWKRNPVTKIKPSKKIYKRTSALTEFRKALKDLN